MSEPQRQSNSASVSRRRLDFFSSSGVLARGGALASTTAPVEAQGFEPEVQRAESVSSSSHFPNRLPFGSSPYKPSAVRDSRRSYGERRSRSDEMPTEPSVPVVRSSFVGPFDELPTEPSVPVVVDGRLDQLRTETPYAVPRPMEAAPSVAAGVSANQPAWQSASRLELLRANVGYATPPTPNSTEPIAGVSPATQNEPPVNKVIATEAPTINHQVPINLAPIGEGLVSEVSTGQAEANHSSASKTLDAWPQPARRLQIPLPPLGSPHVSVATVEHAQGEKVKLRQTVSPVLGGEWIIIESRTPNGPTVRSDYVLPIGQTEALPVTGTAVRTSDAAPEVTPPYARPAFVGWVSVPVVGGEWRQTMRQLEGAKGSTHHDAALLRSPAGAFDLSQVASFASCVQLAVEEALSVDAHSQCRNLCIADPTCWPDYPQDSDRTEANSSNNDFHDDGQKPSGSIVSNPPGNETPTPRGIGDVEPDGTKTAATETKSGVITRAEASLECFGHGFMHVPQHVTLMGMTDCPQTLAEVDGATNTRPRWDSLESFVVGGRIQVDRHDTADATVDKVVADDRQTTSSRVDIRSGVEPTEFGVLQKLTTDQWQGIAVHYEVGAETKPQTGYPQVSDGSASSDSLENNSEPDACDRTSSSSDSDKSSLPGNRWGSSGRWSLW